MDGVNDIQIGRSLRSLRHRLGVRQIDIGRRSGVSQGVVSLIERGRLDRVSLRRLRRVAAELDAEVVIQVRWRGGELSRLLDERHAWLGGRVAAELGRHGWTTVPEVTYAIHGQRGSIDLLAWHPPTRTLLVIEIKTEITSAEETLRRHDEKVRLAPLIAAERFGWSPRVVGRVLVLPATSTARDRIARHAALFRRVYPTGTVGVRAYIRRPTGGALGGLWFFRDTNDVRGTAQSGPRKRIRSHSAGAAALERRPPNRPRTA
jgi:transcriptional regulator with XRE-family HTH domain